jgi:hypothetical protein
MVSVSLRYVCWFDFLKPSIVTRASVSIGDWYPERNIFQILIALTSGGFKYLHLFGVFMMVTSRPTLHPCIFTVFSHTVSKYQLARILICCRHYSDVVMRGLGVHHVQR